MNGNIINFYFWDRNSLLEFLYQICYYVTIQNLKKKMPVWIKRQRRSINEAFFDYFSCICKPVFISGHNTYCLVIWKIKVKLFSSRYQYFDIFCLWTDRISVQMETYFLFVPKCESSENDPRSYWLGNGLKGRCIWMSVYLCNFWDIIIDHIGGRGFQCCKEYRTPP